MQPLTSSCQLQLRHAYWQLLRMRTSHSCTSLRVRPSNNSSQLTRYIIELVLAASLSNKITQLSKDIYFFVFFYVYGSISIRKTVIIHPWRWCRATGWPIICSRGLPPRPWRGSAWPWRGSAWGMAAAPRGTWKGSCRPECPPDGWIPCRAYNIEMKKSWK